MEVLSNWVVEIDILELLPTVLPSFCQYGVARGLATAVHVSVAAVSISAEMKLADAERVGAATKENVLTQ